ncbi:MAG TPA: bifunctional 5,10-methylenetetrahydrofolate dehydrogenase/5,10-methenyltetrahydrofolate cyclohydrolase, partial [Candidatus Peribacteraceae bacterium]|nr:bifunctional 5,10-methylenetetrahydrofolate dehydrogenase/5,10-methenyltetrahydrofolate cyclohydrolase [Candidatus Peribacteraceae bacterium]
MSAQILSGKDIAAKLLSGLKADVKKLDPKLVIVQVGDDPASASYIKQKFKACAEVGMRSEHLHLPENCTEKELMDTVQKLNSDRDVTGFIVQLPLPKHLQHLVETITERIDPKKDVDGFGAANIGKTFMGKDHEQLPPATPAGVIYMLESSGITIEGKHAVIVGRSNIVGKPLAVMLLNRGATVTVCHSKTKDVGAETRKADILCAAVGKAKMITADMVKPGAVVIDIGVSRDEEGLKGDVD